MPGLCQHPEGCVIPENAMRTRGVLLDVWLCYLCRVGELASPSPSTDSMLEVQMQARRKCERYLGHERSF